MKFLIKLGFTLVLFFAPLSVHAANSITVEEVEPLPEESVFIIDEYDDNTYIGFGYITFDTESLPELFIHINGVKNPVQVSSSKDFHPDEEEVFFWLYSLTSGPGYNQFDYYLTLEESGVNLVTTETYRLVVDKRGSYLDSVTRSKAGIYANGIDYVDVTVRIVGEDGNPLSDRKIWIDPTRGFENNDYDSIVPLSDATNENGEQTFRISSTQVGAMSIHVRDVYHGYFQQRHILVVPDGRDDLLRDFRFPKQIKPGDLVKGSGPDVYHIDSLGRRNPFTKVVYDTWYGNGFNSVIELTDEELQSYKLGPAVPFRPGTMIKTPYSNKVYFVDNHSTIRHIVSEDVAFYIYGEYWTEMIHEINETDLYLYTEKEPVKHSNEVDMRIIPDRYEYFSTLFDFPSTPNSEILKY